MVEESIEKAEEIYHKAKERILAAAEEKLARAWPTIRFETRYLNFSSGIPDMNCRFAVVHPEGLQGALAASLYLRESDLREILGDDFATFDAFCRHFELYAGDCFAADRIQWPHYRAAWSDRENFAEAQWGRKQAQFDKERDSFDARISDVEGAFPSSEWLQTPEYL